MRRAPVVLHVERATIYDTGLLEVKPRLSERGTSMTATLPRDFRYNMPTTSTPRKDGAHDWPPQAQTVTRERSVTSVRLRAALATEDDPKAVAVTALFSPLKLGSMAEKEAACTSKGSSTLSAPHTLQRVISTDLNDTGRYSSEISAPSCYSSGSESGECSGAVWIVRHGERVDSVDKGWKKTAERPHDPPLTPAGFEQAAATGRALREHRLDAIYTSPFLRCVQTAKAIVEALGPGAPRIQVEPGLGEWLFNRWFSTQPMDGAMTAAALQHAHGAVVDAEGHTPLWDSDERRAAMRAAGGWEQPYERLPFPESLPQVSHRYTSTLNGLRDATPYALLVTHGFGVQAMAEHASEGKEIEDPSYCSLTRMRRLSNDGGEEWSCDLICRADHLGGEGGGAAAKANGGPMRTIAFSAAAF